jgi:anthranilate synthase component 1
VIQEFSGQFKSEKNDFKFINNGLFGYISYDAVRYFEKWPLLKDNSISIPDVYYAVYQNIIAINHLKMKRISFAIVWRKNNISEIEQLLQSRNIASYKFSKEGEGFSNLTDEEFKHNVALAKSIVSEEMYSNWSYLVGLPKASKETSSMCTERWEASTLPYLFFLITGF